MTPPTRHATSSAAGSQHGASKPFLVIGIVFMALGIANMALLPIGITFFILGAAGAGNPPRDASR